MFTVNEDMSILCTRGDCCHFPVTAMIDGEAYSFKSGDVVRCKIFRKKDCESVVLQRDFVVEAPSDSVEITLSGDDTKFGGVINKPTDFWYEIELNPDTEPHTIRGYDENGPLIFRLYPEGKDVDGEDIEVVGKKTLQELVDYALEHTDAAAKAYATEAANSAGRAESAAQNALDHAKHAKESQEYAATAVMQCSRYVLRAESAAEAAENAAGGGGNITVDDVKPFRFTVTKNGKNYTSSATYEEINEILTAGNRIVICEYEGRELPFVGFFGSLGLVFYTNAFAPNIRITLLEAGGVALRTESKPVTVVSVLDYDAVGDGKADDTDAIQEALYAAEELGLPLYFPCGTYLVSSTITTHTRAADADKQAKNLQIYGDGFGSVIKTTEDFDGDYVFYLDVADAQPRSLWVHDFAINLNADVSGIYFDEIGMKGIVENLWINHLYDKDPTDTNHRAGIECRMATVVTFSRIKIQGNRKRIGSGHENIGIICHGSWSNTFTDCDIIFCKWGIYLNSGSDNTIENCRVDENEYGIYQNSTADTLNYMPETRAYPADGSNGIIHRGTFRNLTIRNNRFERNNQYAIFLAAYSVGADTYMYNAQVTIENNDFSGLGADIAFQTSARDVFRKAIHLYQCKGVVIENNAFAGKPYDESNEESMSQILSGSKVDDLTIRSNVAVSNPLVDGTIVKTSPKISADLLNYKFGKWQPKSLAEQGIVDDIEADQSTRDRWRSEIGNINAALEELHAYAQSLVSGGAAE